ncbi:MAG: hypothetical protein IKR13_03205, partial [Victivallales bacterium]|nr:hypothetical protein [Victivallales bacterium]
DPFPSVESDHVDCFSQIIRRAFHDGHRRLLVWLPNQEWHSQTKAILEGFQTARERNARLGISFILDYPDEHSLSSLREAMERNSEFDALCLRHAAFRNATMLPEWYAWLGERRGFIHTPEALPANFTQETVFQVLGVQGFEKFMLEYFFSGNECTRLAGKRLMSPPFFLS